MKIKKYKKKAMATTWNNEESSFEHSSSDEQQEEKAHLTFMTNFDDKVDTLSEQVDTGPNSQNSLFVELGQQVDTASEQVDTLSEQVDTGPSSQNSLFVELGQQVDTASEQVDTRPCSQNILFSIWDSVSTPPRQVDTLRKKPLKHPKEADPVEAFVGEEFKEDPTIPKCRAS
ncbi:hypothetical protein Taro_002189, partial [Colocasia esculenta]|nr:hypothetical protein [Colocasia esculenta]